MTELLQNLIDGLGRGSIYSLLALGIAVIFGVMHLLNFAHGELITVAGYSAFWALGAGWSWWLVVPLIVVVAVATSLVIEWVAFSRVRGESDFTLLLTSFGVHFVVSAIFLLYVSAGVKQFDQPELGAEHVLGRLIEHRSPRRRGHRRDRVVALLCTTLLAAAHDVWPGATGRRRRLRRRPAYGREVELGHPRRLRPCLAFSPAWRRCSF